MSHSAFHPVSAAECVPFFRAEPFNALPWPAGLVTDTNTNTNNSLILSPSLVDQGGVLLMKINIHKYNVDPSSCWSYTVNLPSSWPMDPGVSNCWYIGGPEATAPLQVVDTDHLTYTQAHLHTEVSSSWLSTVANSSHGLALRDMNTPGSWAAPPTRQLVHLDHTLTVHLHSLQLLASWSHSDPCSHPSDQHLFSLTPVSPLAGTQTHRSSSLQSQTDSWCSDPRLLQLLA